MAEPDSHPTDVHAKALAVNLDASTYGTFAEIGAGQEVARWFLGVGAASGTVAQAISAYDKTFSDDTYGAGTRYVSKERLVAMLDHEYKLLIDRLGKERGDKTRFFVFADTVATRNYQGTNEQHGWMGMRFQDTPGAEPSQLLLHINLGDPHADLQQQAIGLLGVNLVYAVFYQHASAGEFLGGLFDGLSNARIQIDVVELTGPVAAGRDSRLFCLELLRRDMSLAVVFGDDAQPVEPATPLRKRPLLVERAGPGQMGLLVAETFEAARKQLLAEGTKADREPGNVIELSLKQLQEPQPDNEKLLATVQRLSKTATVIVTGFAEDYRLVEYLRRYTAAPIRSIISIATLFRTLEARVYEASPGALLEAFGRLLASDVTAYVAPMKMEPFVAALGGMPTGFVVESAASDSMTLDDIHPKPPVDHLFNYLRSANRLVALK